MKSKQEIDVAQHIPHVLRGAIVIGTTYRVEYQKKPSDGAPSRVIVREKRPLESI